MRSRLIRYSIINITIPIFNIILTSIFWKDEAVRMAIMLVGILVHSIVILLFCKKLRPLFEPSASLLESLGTKRIPAPYEPGSYTIDHTVSAVLMWLGPVAPVFAYLAKLFPREVTNPIPIFSSYFSPNPTLLFSSFAMILGGSIALIMWCKTGQAKYIFSEPAESRRYLYMGFAETVDVGNVAYRYLHSRKDHIELSDSVTANPVKSWF